MRSRSLTAKVKISQTVVENFFGHRREELFHRVQVVSTEALPAALHEYIRWYNAGLRSAARLRPPQRRLTRGSNANALSAI
ncbi:IS3 family transposase [Paenarthrobacter sp. YIM B13468]|uniref:IS3 family transposase n=1 Tax=Paenarthrobacter sp. YIM B13468 TaxID=3366295 RepID=UPI0036704AB5